MSDFERFFADIDAHWALPGPERVHLRLIGSGALMVQTDYVRGTRDSDILETQQRKGEVARHLLDLAGSGTAIHRRHRLYVDVVSSGLPFLPQSPAWRPLTDINLSLKHLLLEALATHLD